MDYLSSGFSDIDHSNDSSIFTSCLVTLNSLPYFQDYKRKSLDLMNAREGSRVLEVGCGLGFDAIALARIVGSTGRVVAVDCSQTMLEAARSRAENLGLPIDFVLADAGRLGLDDGCFDCARVDRTLQHIPEPKTVLREMARVTRGGGHIAAYEPDWGTFVIGSGDRQVTRKITDFWCDTFRSGWIGRYLYGHFMAMGLEDVQVYPSTLVITDLDLAEKVFDIFKNAEKAMNLGLVSSSEVAFWLKGLRKDNLKGRFFCSYTGFMACGRKP
ncbi:MAG: tRNA ((57)-N(1)/adenine(58)-N(1))-methyltransferase TrmI [Euryarchaeota archaeon]|nr:tRNA ((57)-N(1)/adenine(58)-N(1))-methyltransferase TrmI [Euryarchaeota archaeon]